MKDNHIIFEAYLAENGSWEDTPDRVATSKAGALVYFMEMLGTPGDSSLGDIQDAAKEAITAGIENDLIEAILRLPKYQLDPEEIDIVLNLGDHGPMR